MCLCSPKMERTLPKCIKTTKNPSKNNLSASLPLLYFEKENINSKEAKQHFGMIPCWFKKKKKIACLQCQDLGHCSGKF